MARIRADLSAVHGHDQAVAMGVYPSHWGRNWHWSSRVAAEPSRLLKHRANCESEFAPHGRLESALHFSNRWEDFLRSTHLSV